MIIPGTRNSAHEIPQPTTLPGLSPACLIRTFITIVSLLSIIYNGLSPSVNRATHVPRTKDAVPSQILTLRESELRAATDYQNIICMQSVREGRTVCRARLLAHYGRCLSCSDLW